MGGTRFDHLGGTTRIDRETHDRIAAAVAPLGVEACIFPPLRRKASFGDVDMLAPRSGTHAAAIAAGGRGPDAKAALDASDAAVAVAAGAVAHHRESISDPTLHLLLETAAGRVQVDVVSIEDRLLPFARSHLSWGDAGSLAVVVARQAGLKVGMNGVRVVAPTPHGNVAAEIDLSYAETLELVGFDAARHAEGFDDFDAVFRWLAEGALFDPVIWSDAWRTNKARARGMKRPAYLAWQAWLSETRPRRRYDWGSRRGERTPEWTARLLERFPYAAVEIERAALTLATPRADRVRTFFTGTAVSLATGVVGGALAGLMNDVRAELGEDRLARMARDDDREGLARVAREVAARRGALS